MQRAGNKMVSYKNWLNSKLRNLKNSSLLLLTANFLIISPLVKAVKVNIYNSIHKHLKLFVILRESCNL